MNIQKNSAVVFSLVLLVAVLAAGAIYWYWPQDSSQPASPADVGTQVQNTNVNGSLSSSKSDLGGNYSKDTTHVYWGFSSSPDIVQDADPVTFEVIDAANDIGKDKIHVYDAGVILVNVDSSNFATVGGPYYKDATHVWVIPGIGKGTLQQIAGAEASTFVYLGGNSAKDANHTYGFDAKGYLTTDGVTQ